MIPWTELRDWLRAKDEDQIQIESLEQRVVSGLAEELRRHLGAPIQLVEEFEVPNRGVRVEKYFAREPIRGFDSVQSWDGSGWVDLDPGDFVLTRGARRSVVRPASGWFDPGRYRLAYTFGYNDGEAPGDIVAYVFEEVAYQWHRRGTEAMASETSDGHALKYRPRAELDAMRKNVVDNWAQRVVLA